MYRGIKEIDISDQSERERLATTKNRSNQQQEGHDSEVKRYFEMMFSKSIFIEFFISKGDFEKAFPGVLRVS